MSRLAEGSSFYNVPIALRFDGTFRPDAFRAAFAALWGRHEGLRVHFPSPDGDPVQKFLPAEDVPFEEVDLTGVAVSEARLDAIVREEAAGRSTWRADRCCADGSCGSPRTPT